MSFYVSWLTYDMYDVVCVKWLIYDRIYGESFHSLEKYDDWTEELIYALLYVWDKLV